MQAQKDLENNNRLLGWIGAGFGVIGAILLSLNISYSGYGYIFFVISSSILVVWSIAEKQYHQLIMQTIFTLINCIGIVRWLS